MLGSGGSGSGGPTAGHAATGAAAAVVTSQQFCGITCIAASEINEWSCENVILTGSADGVVRVSELIVRCNRVIVDTEIATFEYSKIESLKGL